MFLVKMSSQYFNLWFRLDACDAYLIWFNGEPDGVITNADGKVPCFQSTKDLLSYASSLNLAVETEEPILFDLDILDSWLNAKDNEAVDCKIFLDSWNLFDDVSRSVSGNFDTNRKLTAKIYDKLFWGSNISVVTPVGKSYEPIWTKRELKVMQKVLGVGLSLFIEKISCV